MEILIQADQLSNKQKGFWQSSSVLRKSLKQRLIQGYLWIDRKDTFKKRFFILTQQNLYQFHKNTSKFSEKHVYVTWKLVQPFQQKNQNNQTRYGFTLSRGQNKQDFFVVESSLLDEWIQALNQVGILQDFQQDYTRQSQIGRGTTGNVLLVTKNSNNQKYAVKVINANTLSQNSKTVVLNQIRILRMLNHPCIMKIQRIYQNEDQILIVLDYLEGGELQYYINSIRKFSQDSICIFAKKMLETLKYLKQLNIVHRNLKPQHVLIQRTNDLSNFKISGFGFACVGETFDIVCGTPGYMAPQILREEVYTSKVDIFSVGVILYSVFTGRPAFIGYEEQQILMNNREGKIIIFDKYWRKYSDQAQNFVKLMTNVNQEIRLTIEEALSNRWMKSGLNRLTQKNLGSARTPNARMQRSSQGFSNLRDFYYKSLKSVRENDYPREHFSLNNSRTHYLQPFKDFKYS